MAIILVFLAVAFGGIAYFFAKEEKKYAFCAGLLGPLGWILFRWRSKKIVRQILNIALFINAIILLALLVTVVLGMLS